MIVRTTTGIDGKQIVEMIPETEEDLAELERMARERDVDMRESFADDPEVWASPSD